jgi:hypothetical protein
MGRGGCTPCPVRNLPDGYDTWEDYYKDYLQSPHWLKVSRDIIEARGRKCENCGEERGEINVHHLNYDHLNGETDEDLQVLCRACHDRVHRRKPELAKEPDLIAAIGRDIEAMGIVGEENNRKLVYLAFTSRLLRNPLAIVTRGESSTGKSTLLTGVAKLFPEDDVILMHGHTHASLFNGPENEFEHKILITGERRHNDDPATNHYIRQLISDKETSRRKSIGGEDGKGRWGVEPGKRKGPVAYAESTTQGSIFKEDRTRMVELYTDASAEQSLRVNLRTASYYDEDAPDEDEMEAVVQRHHEFQKSLGRYRVTIPYWQTIAEAIPRHDPRCRRVTQQVLSVVECIAFLHQHRRKLKVLPDGRKRLVATVADYALAHDLLLGPLHAALGVGQHYDECAELRAALPGPEFDSKEALEARRSNGLPVFNNKVTRDARLKEWCKHGMLTLVEEGKSHQAARWEWTTEKPLEEIVLPTVKSIKAAMAAVSR